MDMVKLLLQMYENGKIRCREERKRRMMKR
jgi:hypothetical protein